MQIVYAESKFWKTHQAFKQRYQAKIERAYSAARMLLPDIPSELTFVIQVNSYEAIPETGEGGWIKNSNLILLTVDPGLPYGEEGIIKHIRGTVFHELNHAARYQKGIWHKTFIDSCIMEGIATAFERDFADSKPLWSQYNEREARDWLEEIKDQDHIDHYEYMYRHSDGRRWIGYKVGTYLADQATENSGKDSIALTGLECDEIKRLAEISE